MRAEIWPALGGAVAGLYRHESAAVGDSGWRALLRPTPAGRHHTPTDLACWPMLPYANRIRDGRFELDGVPYALPPSPSGQSHPLHGVGWLARWQLESHSAAQCRLAFDHVGDAHWPWSFAAQLEYQLSGDALSMCLRVRNRDRTTMPVGLGQHPYIPAPPGSRLRLRATHYWSVDDGMLPQGRAQVPADWGLADGMVLGERCLDNCFEVPDGSAELRWPDGAGLRIAGDAARHVQIYHPPAAGFVCVEPVTHLPDALNLPLRVAGAMPMPRLAPGDSQELRVELRYLAPEESRGSAR